jgi:hypothetical protein
MGCDIHMVLERKVGKEWIGIHNFPYWYQRADKNGRDTAWPIATDRNYDRFNALAGVRGEGPAVPRGTPEDASPLARLLIEEWDSDGHSHSWMTLKEAAPIFAKTEWKQSKPDDWAAEYPVCYFFGIEEDQAKDYRLVFWFDN